MSAPTPDRTHLRETIMGFNDGVIATAGLVVGVASAHRPHSTVVLAALSASLAAAVSMACGQILADLVEAARHGHRHPRGRLAANAAVMGLCVVAGSVPEIAPFLLPGWGTAACVAASLALASLAALGLGALSFRLAGLPPARGAGTFFAFIASAAVVGLAVGRAVAGLVP